METIYRDDFNYAICRKRNVTAAEVLSFCESLAIKECPPTCKRIVVYYSGHGAYGMLLMQDGNRVNVDDVTRLFSESSKNIHMVKMIFLDACRVIQDHNDYPVKKARLRLEGAKTICKGNVLVAYAPTQRHRTYGGPSGSQWTNCLVKALKESKGSDSVFDVLTAANRMMGRGESSEFTSSLKETVF